MDEDEYDDYEDDYDNEIELAGEPRSWCSRCDSREDHFLETEELYVCDCSAAALIERYGPEFPIILARPLPQPAYV